MGGLTKFEEFDFESAHKESSFRLAELNSQLARHALFSSRPVTRAVTCEPRKDPIDVAEHWSAPPVRVPRAPKAKPKKIEISVAERRRRLEKALEADKQRDERMRQQRVDKLAKSSSGTSQPFGNRVARFFARPEIQPPFLTRTLLREFELVPGKFLPPGNFSIADFDIPDAGLVVSEEEDVLPTEFARSEISYLIGMVTKFVAFHKPSREFPTTLVSRGVFARLLIVFGFVAESRFNRLAALVSTRQSAQSSGSSGVLGLGANLEIRDAFSLQEALDIFDQHADGVDIFPFPSCMHVTQIVKLLEWLFFETERRSQEAGTKERRKLFGLVASPTTSLPALMIAAKVGNKLKAKRPKTTSVPRQVATGAASEKYTTLRSFFFQAMTQRVDVFLEQRSRQLEVWQRQASAHGEEQLEERKLREDEKDKISAPPGISQKDFDAGMNKWHELQQEVSPAQRLEVASFTWKTNEYFSCSLYEPEVVLTSARLFVLAREIVRAYSSSDAREILGIGGEESKVELERIGLHMKFADFFRFTVDLGLYPEFVNFQQVKELYVSEELLSEFTPVSEFELHARRLDDEDNSFKQKGWMYKDLSEMTSLERKAFIVLSSVEQWISDRFLRVKDVFMQFDSDKNGFLSPYEFHAAVQRLEISFGDRKLTPEEIDRIMSMSDADEDGQLNLDEFDKALARMKECKTHVRQKQDFVSKTVSEMSTNERRGLSLLHSISKFVDKSSFDVFWHKLDMEKTGKVAIDQFASHVANHRQSIGISSHIPTEKLLDIMRLFEVKLDGFIHETDFRSCLAKVQDEVQDPFHENIKAKKGETQTLFAAPALSALLVKLAIRVASQTAHNFDVQTAPSFLKVHFLISLVLKRLSEPAAAVSEPAALEILRASEKVLLAHVKGKTGQLNSATDGLSAFARLQNSRVADKMQAVRGVSESGECPACKTTICEGWGSLTCRHCSPLMTGLTKLRLPLEQLM